MPIPHLRPEALVLTGVLVLLAGCRSPVPIQWSRWGLKEAGADAGRILHEQACEQERNLAERFTSPEGLLWYRLKDDPDPFTGSYSDLADQACWTGYYFAALCCRHQVEPTSTSRDAVARVLAGMEILEKVTGVPGLIARCVAPSPVAGHIANHPETWYDSTTCHGLSFRGDVSKDQYSGYVFGLIVGAELLSHEPELQVRCKQLIARCAQHLSQGELKIRGPDGQVTRFGDMRGRIFFFPIGVNSAIALGLLRAAHKYGHSTPRMVEQMDCLWGSLAPLHIAPFGFRKYSNALMGSVGMAGLVLLEDDAQRRQHLMKLYSDFLDDFRGEGNGFFLSVGALLGLLDVDEQRRCITNLLHLPTRASTESDYINLPRRCLPDRKLRTRSLEVLPLWRRPRSSFRWKSDPYLLDPGPRQGITYSPVDVFCAYWIGRLSGWIPVSSHKRP